MIQKVSSPKDLTPQKALSRIAHMLAEVKEKEKPLSEEEQSAFERDFLVIHSKLVGLLASAAYSEEADEWALHIQRVTQSLYQQYENATDHPLFYFGQLAAAFTHAREARMRLLPKQAVYAAFRSKRGIEILQVLNEKGPLTVGQLAASLTMKQNNLSPILDPLEKAGVVTKERFGRTKRVCILPVGVGILARIGPMEIRAEPQESKKTLQQGLNGLEEKLKSLDPEELENMVTGLGALLDAVSDSHRPRDKNHVKYFIEGSSGNRVGN